MNHDKEVPRAPSPAVPFSKPPPFPRCRRWPPARSVIGAARIPFATPTPSSGLTNTSWGTLRSSAFTLERYGPKGWPGTGSAATKSSLPCLKCRPATCLSSPRPRAWNRKTGFRFGSRPPPA